MHEITYVNEIFTVLKEKSGENIDQGQIVVNARLSPFSHVSAENLQGVF